MSQFQQTRLFIRAVLICALLVFGHVFLTTVTITAGIVSRDKLASSITSGSSLVFLTLLWTTFTLIETVDEGLIPLSVIHNDDGSGLIFERMWVDLVVNGALLASWAIQREQITRVMKAMSPALSSEMTIIPAAFALVFLALAALQMQVVVSVARHVYFYGARELLTLAFWNRKTGHWTERIVLGETAVPGLDEASINDEKMILAAGHATAGDKATA